MTSDATLLAADARARQEALDVRRSFIVQAPAGSGKTELLIQRYLCLLTVVDEPEEVLAITFTRKAATEMQERVLRALEQARDEVEATQAHEKITREIAGRVMQRDAERGWDLINSPRRMRMLTLDALCASIARFLPLSSGLGGTPTTVSDGDAKAVYRAAAVATLDWLAGDESLRRSLELVLEHLDNSTATYVAYIARMLQSRDQWLQIVGTGRMGDPSAVRRSLESNLAFIVTRHLRRLRERIPESAVDEYVRLGAHAGRRLQEAGLLANPIASLADMHAIPDDTAGSAERWRCLADLVLVKDGKWRNRLTKNEGFPPEDKDEKRALADLIGLLSADDTLRAQLHEVRALPAARYEDRQWDVLLALFRVLPVAVSELKRIFGERGVTDHVEVALAAESALGTAEQPGEIAMMMDYRVRHLLVDEMQDTSIGQYRLLETLTAGWEPGDGRSLFCVGDPMQSIYRFRNAEVGRFVLARSSGIGALPLEALTLRRNFRSGEHLVHWFNRVFAQILPATDDIASGAVSYAESVPVESLAGAGEQRLHPLFDASPAGEAQVTAEVIQSCLDRSRAEDLAVLVRSRTQLPLLLAELRARAIPYRAVEIDRLTDLPEVIDLLALTRAWCHAGDRAAWLGLLRSPLVGLRWVDVHALVTGDADSTVWDLMRSGDRLASLSADAQARLGLLAEHLGRLFAVDRSIGLRERVERAWFELGGPALLRDGEQLQNAYSFLRVLDKVDVAGTLPDPSVLDRLLDEERVSSPLVDGCRVQVMTMHKSKGLQFDHVVLPSLGRTTTGGDKSVLSWLDVPGPGGTGRMIISPVGARSELERDTLHQYIESSLKESDRLELDRLLYVACTRARKSLHLVGHVGTGKDGEMRPPAAATPLARLWPAIANEFQAAFEAHRRASGSRVADADEGILAEPILRRLEAGWRLPDAPGRPASAAAATALPVADERAVEFRWVGTVARHAGTIVHRWMHRLSQGKSLPADLDWDRVDAVSARWARQLGVGEEDIGTACTRVRQALARVLDDPRGRWLLSAQGAAELALTGIWEGQRHSIVIDRVCRDDDGVDWIVDYKTGTHEGGDLAGFLEQEARRYAVQLARYRAIYAAYAAYAETPVRTALYFPLLGEFVEVAD
ncbi:MAG: UvrD-helicase domain-containing protein [Gammaproteobacteria bacterium]|nr:UvrD-helicase domain-containing protein [Gammaproteobacteria bacterium]MDH4253879.1 UvrD-helicase domain-containing protein [Gammaproteobacteria bacterium]MDH5309808.1 UvrD-helicase domain-containing protein [Gammaproteobacteria bacterium]